MKFLIAIGIILGFLVGLKAALSVQLMLLCAKCVYVANPGLAKKDLSRRVDFDIGISIFTGLVIGNIYYYLFFFKDVITTSSVVKWFLTP